MEHAQQPIRGGVILNPCYNSFSRTAVEFLSNEGHVYSTIDDDHFRSTNDWCDDLNRRLIANDEIFVKNRGQWQLSISVQDSDLLVPLYIVDCQDNMFRFVLCLFSLVARSMFKFNYEGFTRPVRPRAAFFKQLFLFIKANKKHRGELLWNEAVK